MPQWPAPLAIFFLSVGLGAVYQRTGSLIASFVMHALFNGLGTMMLFLAILVAEQALAVHLSFHLRGSEAQLPSQAVTPHAVAA